MSFSSCSAHRTPIDVSSIYNCIRYAWVLGLLGSGSRSIVAFDSLHFCRSVRGTISTNQDLRSRSYSKTCFPIVQLSID